MLAAFACAITLAACGSSGHSGTGSGRADPGIQFADCMRTHGVPSFADPGSGGGIQIPDGINPRSPAFQSAQKSCAKYMPGGGPLHGHASEQRKLEMLRLARCMRAHGLPSFPDPTASPPASPPGGGNGPAIAFGSPGSFIAVGPNILEAPAFKDAAAACGFPGGGRPPGGAKKALALG